MINFFQIFSFPRQFQIDKNYLRQKYFSLQTQYHPDRFIKASEEEKIRALKASADINEGFRVLSNDLLRAEHLLALEGIVVNKEKDNTYHLSKTLLLEQIELREQQEENNSDEFKNLISEKIKEAITSFEQSFEKKDLEKAAEAVTRLRYLEKIN